MDNKIHDTFIVGQHNLDDIQREWDRKGLQFTLLRRMLQYSIPIKKKKKQSKKAISKSCLDTAGTKHRSQCKNLAEVKKKKKKIFRLGTKHRSQVIALPIQEVS